MTTGSATTKDGVICSATEISRLSGDEEEKLKRRLPRRLGDPLRWLRKFVFWIALIWLLGCLQPLDVLIRTISQLEEDPYSASNRIAVRQAVLHPMLLLVPPVVLVWLVLPGRRTNALYLRSFKNDKRTLPIRKSAKAALGRKFRLSGIRDPRHRRPWLHNFLGFFLSVPIFAFRYSTPKYMNLEAGNNWKERIWRSMGDARCALIDVVDLTPFVIEEIELAYHTLGIERLLFIGDASKTVEQWRETISKLFEDDIKPASINIAVWDATRRGRSQFHATVKTFRTTLPRRPSGPNIDSFGLTKSQGMPTSPVLHRWWFWFRSEMVVAIAFIGIAFIVPRIIPKLSKSSGSIDPLLLTSLATSIYFLLAFFYLLFLSVKYWCECGSQLQRIVTGAFVLILCGELVAVMGAPLLNGRDTRQQLCGFNLRQIYGGIALYEVQHNRLPPAIEYDANGRPMHSWRVRILEHTDFRYIFDEYNFNEPWNGPHNRKLMDKYRDPPAFLFHCPDDTERVSGASNYLMITGPQTLFRQEWRNRPLRFFNILDGLENTLLIVEVIGSTRHWMEPYDLDIDSLKLSVNTATDGSAISSMHAGGAMIVTADGGVYLLSEETAEGVLRRLINPTDEFVVTDEERKRTLLKY